MLVPPFHLRLFARGGAFLLHERLQVQLRTCSTGRAYHQLSKTLLFRLCTLPYPGVIIQGFPAHAVSVLICRYVSRKTYTFPELLEADLEEEFVRGSGPGGQSVNQTANCVMLKHKPSRIVVKCHETRSLEKNRERARERLQERLDLHLHGSNSFLALQEQENSLHRQEKKKKNKARLELKKAFKEREGLD